MYSKNYNDLILDKNTNFIKYNNVFFSLIFFFYFEYYFILTSYTSFRSKNFFFFYPNRLTVLVIFCFIYFIYLWGISNWRRTQHGKFTRGDRKLWAKSLASFWIIELTTILGIYIAACWMNWGPSVIIPRNFVATRKGFLIELTIFTYVLWILYLLRFTLKWNKWQTQTFLVYIILFLILYLIWRDLLLIVGRENINIRSGSKWRYIACPLVFYTFSPVWWYHHFINQHVKLDHNSYFFSLNYFLNNLQDLNYIDIFTNNKNMSLREKFHFLPYLESDEWKSLTIFDLNFLSSKQRVATLGTIFFNTSDISSSSLASYKYYPRRIGSHYKKIAIWTILLFLKIWHHTMLFIWWFFYLIKLVGKRKNSYSYLSICYFNLYCCFLICVLIYLFNYLHFYERFFKILKNKPLMRGSKKTRTRFLEAFLYNFYIFYFFFTQFFTKKFYKFDESFGHYNVVDTYVEIVLTLVRNSILINYYLQETGDFIWLNVLKKNIFQFTETFIVDDSSLKTMQFLKNFYIKGHMPI